MVPPPPPVVWFWVLGVRAASLWCGLWLSSWPLLCLFGASPRSHIRSVVSHLAGVSGVCDDHARVCGSRHRCFVRSFPCYLHNGQVHHLFLGEWVNPVLGNAGEWVSRVFKDQVYGAFKLFFPHLADWFVDCGYRVRDFEFLFQIFVRCCPASLRES